MKTYDTQLDYCNARQLYDEIMRRRVDLIEVSWFDGSKNEIPT